MNDDINYTRSHGKLRRLTPRDFDKHMTPKLMRSSVVLPSQHQSYAVCVEFAKAWFIDKFKQHYFNSVYVDGTHSFDEFRKFSTLDKQMKRGNPMLAIIPTINMEHNRDWIDSNPEIPLLLRRSRLEGTFFNDIVNPKQLHLQLIFKTILMNFTYRIRQDTRAQQLDTVEFIKVNHRAGWTENCTLDLDVHVPKVIITQIAWDNNFKIDEKGDPVDSLEMLAYLNAHSYIPFLYKLRCSTGNKEYFIKVPNCSAHIKADMPSFDDGERQDQLNTNYMVDFQIEVEMTAPYCYTYFSQASQDYICGKPIYTDSAISVMAAIKTDIPPIDEHNWELFTTTEYLVDDEDLYKPLTIDFREFFSNTEMAMIINYTRRIGINPAIFMNFKIFNDGIPRRFCIDWETMECKVCDPITNLTTVIAIYCDLKYINETKINLQHLDWNPSRII